MTSTWSPARTRAAPKDALVWLETTGSGGKTQLTMQHLIWNGKCAVADVRCQRLEPLASTRRVDNFDDMTTTNATQHPAARTEFLPFSPPFVTEEDIAAVADAMRSGWLSTGPKTKQFEQEVAEYVGAPGTLALNSCTAGLHVALATHGVGPGDEVIVPSMTFAATANVVEHVGARPILVDVDPDTLCISPDAVARAVTPRTRAIIPVHYAGHPADIDAIDTIASQAGAIVIEDAAHALGAAFRGRAIGAGKNPVSYSFYATKNLTTGEGGMLTGDPEFLARARVVSLHGMSRDAWKRFDRSGSWRYEIALPGFKYNMTDSQAALGLSQLRRFDDMQRRRREIFEIYNAAFGKSDALDVPVVRPDVTHAYHLYVLRLRPEALRIGRDQFIEELKERNIGTSVHYIPLHEHPFYRDRYDLRPESFPVSHDAYERMLSLPLHPGLSDDDVTDVVDAVLGLVEIFRAT
jgi:dTDP-4-amino-4,6-dideoxygalactose transaminase